MEQLLQQLLQRWEQAFDELDQIIHHKAQAKTTLYAEGFRYSVENFTPEFFPGEGPMLKNKDGINPISLHEYMFSAEGRPCFVTFKHDYNQVTWEGYYTYSDSIVEYVEYCLNTGIPSVVHRLILEDGKKIAYQSILINGRGSGFYSTVSKKEIIEKIKNDDHTLIYRVTSYIYGPLDRIEKATSLCQMSGLGKYTTYDEYSYDEHQNLDAIRTFFEDGQNRLSYCRIPENLSKDLLIEIVAEAMAQSVSVILEKAAIEQPINILELNYHYAGSYVPFVVFKSAREVNEQLSEGQFQFINDYYNALQVDARPFERQFAQLEQMMKETDDSDLARTMLRKAAYLLTRNKLFGKIKTTGDFAAYAIDWSLEGHSNDDFREILIECGAEPDTIDAWKQRGILPVA